MLAGTVDRCNREIRHLQDKADNLRARISRMEAEAAKLARQREVAQTRLVALDRTMHLVDSRVRPDAAGSMNAVAGSRYGKRGALREFVANTLEAAAPKGMDRKSLAWLANTHFNLGLSDEVSLFRFIQNSLKHALHDLKVRGLVVLDRPVRSQAPGLWRWRGEVQPSLAELQQMVSLLI